jgi:hypothetical protein
MTVQNDEMRQMLKTQGIIHKMPNKAQPTKHKLVL